MPEVTDLRPGDPESIGGYRVVSRLGSGGQGVVFLAAASSGELVAIKRLLPGLGDTLARAQFAKEVAAARLVAPFCTAQVVDAQLDGDSPYVVSEFISGPSLQQQIQHSGPIQGTALQRMAIGTVTALAAIHQAGVVHRDFKPANVMISPEGPRVIDFGIARDLATEMTVTSRVFGTPAYMSPEQLRADAVGPATDMFAWASVMAYAATGRAPFDAPHLAAVMYRITAGEPDLSGVPDHLVTVLLQCLEKDPARRPTAQQTLAQLLGRPASQPDQVDPTVVLAEATGLVRDSAGAPTVPRLPDVQPSPLAQPASSIGQPIWGTPPEVARPEPVAFDTRVSPSWGTPPEVARPEPAGLDTRVSPAGSVGRPARPPRQRRQQGLLTMAVLLMTILGGAVVFNGVPDWLANDDLAVPSGDQEGQDLPASSPAKVVASPVTDLKGSTGGIVLGDAGGIPAPFAGTWKGKILESTGGHATVRLTLKAGATSGRLKLTEFGCSGTVKMTSAVVEVLTLDAEMTRDPKHRCAQSSQVYVTLLSGDGLQFSIVDAGRPKRAGTGTLHS